MNRVRNFTLLIRNNWKKSVFFGGVAAFGASVVVDRIRIKNLMRVYCEQAVRFGDQPLGPLSPPRHVTVILNPEANKKKAKVRFEKYVAPILHCAGLKVSVVTTEAKGQSQDLMNIMSDTDAVIVAGGDGTIHESVTGLLNRPDGVRFPLGIIPLGNVNSASKSIHQSSPQTGSKLMREVKAIADATLSVVKENVQQIDVLKVETNKTEKPIYAVDGLNFGLMRDVLAQADKYWYLGNNMKPFLAMSSHVIWKRFQDLAYDRPIQIQYTDPCSGCSRCRQPVPVVEDVKPFEVKRWWSAFVPRPKAGTAELRIETPARKTDYSVIHNADCGVWHSLNEPASDGHCINLLVKNDPISQSAELFLHNSDNEHLSKGSLILDAAEVRNGLPPKDATEKIVFRDLRVTLAAEADDSLKSIDDSESHGKQGNDGEEEAVPVQSSTASSKSVQPAKFSTISIDNEEYPVSDVCITRIREAVTVYSPAPAVAATPAASFATSCVLFFFSFLPFSRALDDCSDAIGKQIREGRECWSKSGTCLDSDDQCFCSNGTCTAQQSFAGSWYFPLLVLILAMISLTNVLIRLNFGDALFLWLEKAKKKEKKNKEKKNKETKTKEKGKKKVKHQKTLSVLHPEKELTAC